MRIPLLGACVVTLGVVGSAAAQTPFPTPKPTPFAVGSVELQVHVSTTDDQMTPAVANGANKGFVVTWTSDGQDGDGYGVFARQFDAAGNPVSGELQVNTTTTGKQYDSAIASDDDGDFVVVWASYLGAGAYTEVFARLYDSGGTPLTGEFQVNTFTTGYQYAPDVARNGNGFVVTWSSIPSLGQPSQDGDQGGIYARRFDTAGASLGGEFLVNSTTTNDQRMTSISMTDFGNFVVVWASGGQDGEMTGIVGRQFDNAGTPFGPEFQVNTYTTGYQVLPDVAVGDQYGFMVTWSSSMGDGSSSGIFARLFASSEPGPDFQVNTHTLLAQNRARIARDRSETGGYVVVWQGFGQDDPNAAGFAGVFAQRFQNVPFPTSAFYLSQAPRLGSEYRVNTYTTGTQFMPDVVVGEDGRFVIAWDSFGQDASGSGIFARRFHFPAAGTMKVDQSPGGGTSNLNGVLEPGERAVVEPSWTNSQPTTSPLPLSGTAANLTGADGPVYTIDDPSADYGTIDPGATNDCAQTDNCYEMTVSGARPAPHWDATFDESLISAGGLGPVPALTKTWALHVGGSFPDVPQDGFYPFIETLFHDGITAGGGCGAGNYCGDDQVLRQQMAVFLIKSKMGASFVPPPATGTVFSDVPASNPFAPWIEQLYLAGITGGCSAAPLNYCPANPVNRQQMAAFLLKTLNGPAYSPPLCTGVFGDVDCLNPFAPFIEDLFARGIAAGCQAAPPLYCPGSATLRKQMAAFLVRTFGLQLYGAD